MLSGLRQFLPVSYLISREPDYTGIQLTMLPFAAEDESQWFSEVPRPKIKAAAHVSGFPDSFQIMWPLCQEVLPSLPTVILILVYRS